MGCLSCLLHILTALCLNNRNGLFFIAEGNVPAVEVLFIMILMIFLICTFLPCTFHSKYLSSVKLHYTNLLKTSFLVPSVHVQFSVNTLINQIYSIYKISLHHCRILGVNRCSCEDAEGQCSTWKPVCKTKVWPFKTQGHEDLFTCVFTVSNIADIWWVVWVLTC